MQALIVGGDRIESIKRQVIAQGYNHIEHWSGRKKGFLNRSLSSRTRLIVLICDYINHSLALKLKNKAQRQGIPVVYSRHCVHELRDKLSNRQKIDDACCCCYSF